MNWLSPDERGARLVGVAADPPSYMFLFRSMDPEHDSRVLNSPFPLTVAMEVRIRFCPWCGANLAKKYGKQQALPRLPWSPCGSPF